MSALTIEIALQLPSNTRLVSAQFDGNDLLLTVHVETCHPTDDKMPPTLFAEGRQWNIEGGYSAAQPTPLGVSGKVYVIQYYPVVKEWVDE